MLVLAASVLLGSSLADRAWLESSAAADACVGAAVCCWGAAESVWVRSVSRAVLLGVLSSCCARVLTVSESAAPSPATAAHRLSVVDGRGVAALVRQCRWCVLREERRWGAANSCVLACVYRRGVWVVKRGVLSAL